MEAIWGTVIGTVLGCIVIVGAIIMGDRVYYSPHVQMVSIILMVFFMAGLLGGLYIGWLM